MQGADLKENSEDIKEQQPELPWWQITLRGIVMGVADLVPGISGGTLALILGIYPRLIAALSNFNISDLLALKNQGVVAGINTIWKKVDGWFLLSLFAGIGLSMMLLSRVLSWVLAFYPHYLFALFFGLVIMSLPWLVKQVKHWTGSTVILIVVGIVIGASLSVLSPVDSSVDMPIYLWTFAGFVALSAMLLPGVSGSFLLLLFGLYHGFIEAIKTFDLPVLFFIALGAIFALIWFSKGINWLLNNHWSSTLAFLTGLVTGALLKIWPWHEKMQVNKWSFDLPTIPLDLPVDNLFSAFIAMMIGGIIARILLKLSA